MKAPWMVALALACIAPTIATAQLYVPIPYRASDPFLFCTSGWSPVQAAMGWIPAPPYTTGLIIPLHPTWWWSTDDWVALGYYQTVCPAAIKSGVWTGATPANVTPVFH